MLKSQPAEIYAFASDYFKAKAESAVDVSGAASFLRHARGSPVSPRRARTLSLPAACAAARRGASALCCAAFLPCAASPGWRLTCAACCRADELEALEDDEELDLDDPALEDATVKIQSTYRGYRSRKQGAEQRQSDKFNEMYDPEDADLKESAAKIQAGYRGHQARKERKREEQSAVKIQASRPCVPLLAASHR